MIRRKYILQLAVISCAVLASACAERVGVRYAFDQLKPQGYLTQPNMGFRSGDRFRIRFVPDQNCFVYVLHEGSDGRFSMLYPLSEVESGRNWVAKHQRVQIPSSGNLVVDEQPGVERMHIVASVRPVRYFESLRGHENQIPPDEFKAAIKNLDIAYKVEGVKWSHQGREFTHEVIKNSSILHCNVEIIHN